MKEWASRGGEQDTQMDVPLHNLYLNAVTHSHNYKCRDTPHILMHAHIYVHISTQHTHMQPTHTNEYTLTYMLIHSHMATNSCRQPHSHIHPLISTYAHIFMHKHIQNAHTNHCTHSHTDSDQHLCLSLFLWEVEMII